MCNKVIFFFKQSYEGKSSVKMEYVCNVPQITNTTHLVDHDYAVTRYFDIYNDATDESMQKGLLVNVCPHCVLFSQFASATRAQLYFSREEQYFSSFRRISICQCKCV